MSDVDITLAELADDTTSPHSTPQPSSATDSWSALRAGDEHAETIKALDKLAVRILKGLREIPLNPTQVRLVVDEIQRVHQRINREYNQIRPHSSPGQQPSAPETWRP